MKAIHLLVILLMPLALAACISAGTQTAIPPTVSPAPSVTFTPPPANTAARTPLPSSEPSLTFTPSPSPAPIEQVNFNGVSFEMDPALGMVFITETATQTVSANNLPLPFAPQYTSFTLVGPLKGEGYPPLGSFAVYEISAERLLTGDERANDHLQTLQQAVAGQTARFPGPWLPSGAAVYFQAQGRRVAFPGGAGVRSFIASAQIISPVNPSRLTYYYQGLTDDGRFYIVGDFEVAVLAPLPPRPTGTPGPGYDAAIAEYNRQIESLVEGLQPGDFAPNLELLDALFASLRIDVPPPLAPTLQECASFGPLEETAPTEADALAQGYELVVSKPLEGTAYHADIYRHPTRLDEMHLYVVQDEDGQTTTLYHAALPLLSFTATVNFSPVAREWQDLNGDGAFEIAYQAGTGGNCAGCEWMCVLTLDADGQVTELGRVTYPYTLADVNDDGLAEIIQNEVMPVDGVERYAWPGVPAIYAWDGEAYREASDRFPEYYQLAIDAITLQVATLQQETQVTSPNYLMPAAALLLHYHKAGRLAEGWPLFLNATDPLQYRYEMTAEAFAVLQSLRESVPDHIYATYP
jgi:hypothetical protein